MPHEGLPRFLYPYLLLYCHCLPHRSFKHCGDCGDGDGRSLEGDASSGMRLFYSQDLWENALTELAGERYTTA